MVDYDSIIQPGRVGHVTQEITLAKIHGEFFKKSVSVTSNASNEKERTILAVRGRLLPIVGISKHFIRLKKDIPFELLLRSEKKDFKVNDVAFVSTSHVSKVPSWQKELPIVINYTQKRSEKPDSVGYYDYKLLMTFDANLDETKHGEFIIKTNCSRKKVIKIKGMIDLFK